MVYFFMATKLKGKDENTTWEEIRNVVFGGGMGGANATGALITNFDMSKFKLGNLDSNMHISEILSKMDI